MTATAPTATTRRRLFRKKPTLGGVIGQILLLAWLVVVLVPLAAALLSSVKNNQQIYTDPLGIDLGDIHWENFTQALAGPVGGRPLLDYVLNSVIATTLSIAVGVSLSILAAYGLARAGGRLSSVLNRSFTILLTVPILATLVPIFTMLNAASLIDNVWALAFVYAAFMIPPTALLMRPYFAAIPLEITEAARIDGASERRMFTSIILPMALPTISGVIVINVIAIWSELLIASTLLVSPATKTLPAGLLSFKGQYSTLLGVQSAALLLAAAPLVIMFFIFSRRITEGMQAGVFK